jgi:hypothetical protein
MCTDNKKNKRRVGSISHNFTELFTRLYIVKAVGLRRINTYIERSPKAPRKERSAQRLVCVIGLQMHTALPGLINFHKKIMFLLIIIIICYPNILREKCK